jgi:protein tyrosine phosphatase (PTP) superfamily phosphohydrolase (DUF442 family)
MSNWEFWSPYMRAWRKTWSGKLDTSLKSRLYAYVDMLFVDHGILRYLFANHYKVSDQVERQNHITPWGVRRAARRGIKTIINLRGDNHLGSYLLSKKACARHGITLVDMKTYSRRPPHKETVLAAKKLFDEVEYPILMHCKSGADRAGLMSALYLILHEGRPVSEAKKQLHWRYGHFRQAKTGVLDCFFEAYEKANAERPMDFITWVESEYEPAEVAKGCRNSRWANWLVDKLIRRE